MTAPGVEPLLNLNDSELEWKRFERFCLDLVKSLPEVRDAHLYGTRGEDQQGIDIHVDLVDGRVRTIQCRRVAKFGKNDASRTINQTTYTADEHEVWSTCPTTTGARKLIRETPRWEAKDIEQLSSVVRQLPREVGRWLVEDHLGQIERRRVLGPDAELVVALACAWSREATGTPAFFRRISRSSAGIFLIVVSENAPTFTGWAHSSSSRLTMRSGHRVRPQADPRRRAHGRGRARTRADAPKPRGQRAADLRPLLRPYVVGEPRRVAISPRQRHDCLQSTSRQRRPSSSD